MLRDDGYSSGPDFAVGIKRPTRSASRSRSFGMGPRRITGPPLHRLTPDTLSRGLTDGERSCSVLLPAGFASSPARARDWWSLTPPFHLCPAIGGVVCSLWHFPYSRPRLDRSGRRQEPLPLGGAVSCGVRTFLPPLQSAGHGRDPSGRAQGTGSSHPASLHGLIYG